MLEDNFTGYGPLAFVSSAEVTLYSPLAFVSSTEVTLYSPLAFVSSTEVTLFGIFILCFFLLLLALCVAGMWLTKRQEKGALSPYSKTPLRRCVDLPFQSKVDVLRYLFNYHQYDNRIFELRRATFCRDTGRIFTGSVTWYDVIDIDWSFLSKRYPGHYVSWGSLTDDQQMLVRTVHPSMEGFQTEFSSSTPQPSGIEAKYAFAKPGPLYVDLETLTLLGWKCVPETELEVLIVQKPKKIH